MKYFVKSYIFISFFVLSLHLIQVQCNEDQLPAIDEQYHLVKEAYRVALDMFLQERASYNKLKSVALQEMNTFLDLVHVMNRQMAKDLKSALNNFYQTNQLHDFSDCIISLEEMLDIADHCVITLDLKLVEIRDNYRDIVINFQDVRNFDKVDKCRKKLPDEVAVAQCMLHQAVLFYETMKDDLLTIARMKTVQHAQDVDVSLKDVAKCLKAFVPNFYELISVDIYLSNCKYIKEIDKAFLNLINDKIWAFNSTIITKERSAAIKITDRHLTKYDTNWLDSE